MMQSPQTSPDDAHRQAVREHNLRAAAQNTANEQRLADPGDAAARFPFNGRWTRRDWAHASVFATLGALVIGLVPGFSNAMRISEDVPALTTMALPLPPLSAAAQKAAQPLHNWELVKVESGQTLGAIFDKRGVAAATLHRMLDAAGDDKTLLTRLRPGVELGFEQAADGRLLAFRYDRSDTQRVELSLAGDEVAQKVIERPVEVRTAVVSGKVGKSLFHSARKLGLSPSVINTLTDDVFKYDIDFDRDVTSGDRFSVVVEQTWREGELIKTGPVSAAVFTAKGKPFTAIRFERDGKAEYFTADGRPLKKSFIRSPIQYARLSSRFGTRRHPVLGTSRMHKGVDYAAKTGTPIMAAGDARVVSAGWQGGYGNAVVLDHGRGYTTLYGHMSRLGKFKRGQRVAQGDVIGYVGSTGMSTGPHLHYEFRINGVHRNPLQHTMPPPEPLGGAALAQFRKQTAPALERIREVEEIIYAVLPAQPSQDDPQVAAATPVRGK
ncbi:MAG TPA: peptidoglycan DD-metalloendopeptidase family protein [Luteimonas sp.]|nr:peptidoglycan DD-metalloendopeptidase family protein [Luteimonas sp.]HRO26594.1 peptidoglycan DD-metalloendopeptidase family protein [Luteimonas sp.]HRP72077.1 peptidoglycan DD-metalloendopeptidase family protein [Luteimonas sp.]